jgi:hypothetical protein
MNRGMLSDATNNVAGLNTNTTAKQAGKSTPRAPGSAAKSMESSKKRTRAAADSTTKSATADALVAVSVPPVATQSMAIVSEEEVCAVHLIFLSCV